MAEAEVERPRRPQERRIKDVVVRQRVFGRGGCQQPPSRGRRQRARVEEAGREVHARLRRHGHRLRRLQYAQVRAQRHGALHRSDTISEGKLSRFVGKCKLTCFVRKCKNTRFV